MFARFPHLPDDASREEQRRHRLEWHALIARLDAERDLRNSLGGEDDACGIAALMAEGSFDPRAAEMIFSLAASVRVSGDLPERRFSPDDLARLSQAITDGAARLRNPKPYDCNNRAQTADPGLRANTGDTATPVAGTRPDGNVSRTR
ncbi:hypothetical protein [Croceicoccus bisphenolivorans]|uniref:hypothetical protein n=1 Tax=Croceicoccus bisphenolivorans TaxID=1783232 RepID=UPI000AFE1EEC|nr:hypothetical protein [Croceicoccus bisphenolivorans]